jgi:hypothetical protein
MNGSRFVIVPNCPRGSISSEAKLLCKISEGGVRMLSHTE